MTGPGRPQPAVREAAPADLPRLRAIQSAALAEPSPDLLAAGIGGPPLVLGIETDVLVGYVLVLAHGDVAYVAELAVAPGEQGRGHGSHLLRALFESLRERDVERVRLTARAADERVLSFYRSLGFAAVDRATDYYEDDDGVVLARDL